MGFWTLCWWDQKWVIIFWFIAHVLRANQKNLIEITIFLTKHGKNTITHPCRLEGNNFNVECFLFLKAGWFRVKARACATCTGCEPIVSWDVRMSSPNTPNMLLKLLRIIDGTLCISVTLFVCGRCTVPWIGYNTWDMGRNEKFPLSYFLMESVAY